MAALTKVCSSAARCQWQRSRRRILARIQKRNPNSAVTVRDGGERASRTRHQDFRKTRSQAMASIAQPRVQAPALPRPRVEASGLWSWLTTVDHKRIAKLYGVSAFIFFLLGGLLAVLFRAHLTRPEINIVDAQRYIELFTMHGTTMIFLVVMPLSVAFFNLVVPLQIGARDVAFPRLNGFSYWTFLAGATILYIPVLFSLPGIFLNIAGTAWTSLFGAGLPTALLSLGNLWPFPWFNGWPFAEFVPDQGWYGYAPLTSPLFSGRE